MAAGTAITAVAKAVPFVSRAGKSVFKKHTVAGQFAKGMGTGATIGGIAGSIIPGVGNIVGTVVGAAIGGTISVISGWIGGGKRKKKQIAAENKRLFDDRRKHQNLVAAHNAINGDSDKPANAPVDTPAVPTVQRKTTTINTPANKQTVAEAIKKSEEITPTPKAEKTPVNSKKSLASKIAEGLITYAVADKVTMEKPRKRDNSNLALNALKERASLARKTFRNNPVLPHVQPINGRANPFRHSLSI